jgi:hypothetical protein
LEVVEELTVVGKVLSGEKMPGKID